MTKWKCPTCGNRYHWPQAFAKCGYDDGDGKVETPDVADILDAAGYSVNYARYGPHNTIITSIQRTGTSTCHSPIRKSSSAMTILLLIYQQTSRTS